MSIAPNTTLRALLDVSASISLLEGTQTVVKDESGTDRAVTVPYKFSGRTRWNLHKNLGILKKVSEKFVADRDAIILAISNGTGRIEQDDERGTKEFTEKVNALLDVGTAPAGLLTLSVADLNLDDNQIPFNVLSALGPIVVE